MSRAGALNDSEMASEMNKMVRLFPAGHSQRDPVDWLGMPKGRGISVEVQVARTLGGESEDQWRKGQEAQS